MKRTTTILTGTCLLCSTFMQAHAQHKTAFINNIEVIPQVSTAAPATGSAITSAIVGTTSHSASDAIEQCTSIQFKYAVILNREVESIRNLALYNFIEEWMSTPYQYGGNSKSGIDCSSFSIHLFQQVYGLILPRSSKDQYAACAKIARTDLQEGDLVFFHTGKDVSHVGVYLGNDYFVHSSTHTGVTIDNLTETYYNKHFTGGGRISR